MKWLRRFLSKGNKQSKTRDETVQITDDTLVSKRLKTNEDILRRLFDKADDIIFRSLHVPGEKGTFTCLIVYIQGLTNELAISNQIIERIIRQFEFTESQSANQLDPPLPYASVTMADTEIKDGLADIIQSILQGKTAIFVDNMSFALVAETRDWPRRDVEDPSSEPVVRGSREGFIETLFINTSLIRRRIQDPNLKMNYLTIGRRTQTTVCVSYIDDVTNPAIVEEVIRRLQVIDNDGILNSAEIQEYIEDKQPTIFPLTMATERPDRCYHALLDGAVVILVEGTSFSLIVPSIFSDFQTSVEDFHRNVYFVGLIRFLRLFSQIVSVTLPALYVALISFHPELIPTRLALTIAGTRQGIPFPSEIEMFLILISAEVLLESAVRLPKALGQTVGIVGGLILGEAAVRAGVISSIMIIVISVTLITSFTIPSPQLLTPVRAARYFVFAAASIFGLYGLVLAMLTILVHLLTLESFGVPYLSPYAPLRLGSLGAETGPYRIPIWARLYRPKPFRPIDKQRQQPYIDIRQTPDIEKAQRDVLRRKEKKNN